MNVREIARWTFENRTVLSITVRGEAVDTTEDVLDWLEILIGLKRKELAQMAAKASPSFSNAPITVGRCSSEECGSGDSPVPQTQLQ